MASKSVALRMAGLSGSGLVLGLVARSGLGLGLGLGLVIRGLGWGWGQGQG